MDSVARPWVELWDYLDGNFWHVWEWASQALSEEEIGWQPIPEVASVGWNLQHLGEMLDHYLSKVFGYCPGVAKGPLPTMMAGSRDDGRFRDLPALVGYHRTVRGLYRKFLQELTAEDFTLTIERSGRRAITYSWAIGHVAEHESYHVGKCTLLRSLLLNRRNTAAPGLLQS